MVITTERLRLLPWSAGDAPLLTPIATDPEVMLFITGGVPWSEAQIAAAVERQSHAYAERGVCRWRLELIATGETIGFCGPGKLTGFDEPELGWWLARAHWGRGYATEAGHAALDDAFGRCAIPKLISIAVPDNERSLRVMHRLGFQFEREAMHAGLLHWVHGLSSK